jgi:RHS repeat-associated protein
VTFGYDAEARLTEADTWAPNGAGGWTLANTTRFAWDGTNLIGEFDGNNTLLRSFAWGPTGLLGITDFTSGSPLTYVPVKDATGSIVQLLDTNGNVVADFHYDAWGVRTAAGPAAGACPFGFAGMLMGPTTGLYYDNARWYSAPQGRFLTPDPSGAAGGLNLEAYCGNDPVNRVDPTGTRFTTLMKIAQTLGDFAFAANPVTLPAVVAVHRQEVASVVSSGAKSLGSGIANAAVQNALHPESFQAGEVIGIGNGAAKVVTGPMNLAAGGRGLMDRVIMEAIDEPDSRIDAAISLDPDIAQLAAPDRIREQIYQGTIQDFTKAGFDSGALVLIWGRFLTLDI